MKRYRVVIPYYYEFYVNAENEKEALEEAHSTDGKIFSYDDTQALIEEQANLCHCGKEIEPEMEWCRECHEREFRRK